MKIPGCRFRQQTKDCSRKIFLSFKVSFGRTNPNSFGHFLDNWRSESKRREKACGPEPYLQHLAQTFIRPGKCSMYIDLVGDFVPRPESTVHLRQYMIATGRGRGLARCTRSART